MQGVCCFSTFTIVEKQFQENILHLIPNIGTKTLYVATSGGVDSMVLLALCLKTGANPIALHCNFKLRGKESDNDEIFVKEFCKTKNILCITTQFETATIAKENNEAIQVTARNLRYDWFDTFIQADPNAVLLTAHHQNDSVETFFINLLRGTGLYGLNGIPEKRNQIYRPLLIFSKNEIIAHANKNAIEYREDSSNQSTKYTRNKLRHEIIPSLESVSPQFSRKVVTLMNELKQTTDYIDLMVEDFQKTHMRIENSISYLPIAALNTLPYPIALRLLNGYGVSRLQFSEIIKLGNAQTGAIIENENFTFLKDRTNLLISAKQLTEKVDIDLHKDQVPVTFRSFNTAIRFTIISEKPTMFSNDIAYLDADKLQFPLHISNQFIGLKIQPLGMKGHKLVSDILTDAKQNRFEKMRQLIVQDKKNIVWIVGQTLHHHYRLTEDTKNILKVELLE